MSCFSCFLIYFGFRFWWDGEHNTTQHDKTNHNNRHTLGAAGGIEAVVAVRSIKDNIVPPTINYSTPDPECDLDYVPNEKREMEVTGAMSTNLGFGGHNAAILFKKYKE